MKSLGSIIILALFTLSCVTQKTKFSKKAPIEAWVDSTALLENSFVGIKIYDPATKEVLFSKNEKKYFTPASNTKLLTLYSCLKSLGDSIPALKYAQKEDKLFVIGTGDPTFLHPDFPLTNTFNFLKMANAITLVFPDEKNKNEALGLGWAWDDYNDYYQPERTAFPIYGNILRVSKNASNMSINPSFFKNSIVATENQFSEIRRDLDKNLFYTNSKINQKPSFIQDIPFKTSNQLLGKLLEDTLKKTIEFGPLLSITDYKTLYSLPVDTVYRRMMQESDNMLAEQLLILAGGKTGDAITTEQSIEVVQSKFMSDMPQKFKWVDGSGLSRYNLFTPESLVFLLDKMLKEFPKERVFSLMSIGGKVGTLKSSYKSDVPYVYAKTGTLSGVYNQSGYLITKSGRLLIFSFMNNNFTIPTSKIRNNTNEIMTWIHENY
jgi:serine-type D-Ala-D-Ala carboxypeptidase/endopeptidase (penicillin-binding protein 4)